MSLSTERMAETEQSRQELIEEFQGDAGESWSHRYKPGSCGCHELLDRAALIGDLLEESVLRHPACVANAEWFALADEAVTALRELYQRVGAEHCSAPNSGASEA